MRCYCGFGRGSMHWLPPKSLKSGWRYGPESMRWRSINIREDYVAHHSTCSPAQPSRSFSNSWLLSRPLTRKKREHARFAPENNAADRHESLPALTTGKERVEGQEMEFSISFVDACLFTYNRLLAFEAPRNSVLEAEDCVKIFHVRFFRPLLLPDFRCLHVLEGPGIHVIYVTFTCIN